MNKNKYGRGYVFIYDPNKKDFYISQGCKLVDSEVHKKTNRVFWIFEYEDTKEAYQKWMNNKYNNRVD